VSEDLTEDEITEETGCLKAIRLNRIVNGQKVPTLSILLIFNQGAAPEYVTIGYTRYLTRAYIPVPTRCNKCQRFNHTAKACRGKETCSRCAGEHSYEHCPDNTKVKCANCQEAHSAAYKGCVKYQTATKVVRLAESSGLSYAAAAKRQQAITVQSVKTVSQIVQTVAVVKSTCTIETQTPPDRVEMSTQTEDSYFNTQLPPPSTQLCQGATPTRKRQSTSHDSRQDKRSVEPRRESQASASSDLSFKLPAAPPPTMSDEELQGIIAQYGNRPFNLTDYIDTSAETKQHPPGPSKEKKDVKKQLGRKN